MSYSINLLTDKTQELSYGEDYDIASSSIPKSPDFSVSPFSRYATPSDTFSVLSAPFALTFSTLHPNTDTPLIGTILAPDYAIHYVVEAEDFKRINAGFSLHQHNTYELIYVIEGDFYQTIEQERHKYTAGSCCLLSPSVFHTEDFHSDCRFATLSCSSEFLVHTLLRKDICHFDSEKVFFGQDLHDFFEQHLTNNVYEGKHYIDFIPRMDENWIFRHINQLFDRLTWQFLNREAGASFHIQALTFSLFSLLGNPEYFHTTPITLGTPAEAALFALLSKRIKESNGRMTRQQLMDEFHYSGTYLNHIIKKFTGMNITRYGNTFSMQTAAHLLTETDLGITEIISRLSFPDQTHFYRLFQLTYGMSPKKYRAEHTLRQKR